MLFIKSQVQDEVIATEWHIGEPFEYLGQVVEFQADGDELNLITEAMAASAGENRIVDYTKMSGFRSKINEALQKAGLALYQAAFWRADRPLPDDGKPLWEALRDALGLEPGQSPRPLPRNDSARWLIEYRTARPVPIYAGDRKAYSIDPEAALHFATREEAKKYMLENGYGSPWHETEHVFI